MSKNKLTKFAENEKAPNIIQPGKPLFERIKGNWHIDYFKNDHPITLEIACGRGEYTVGLARHFPNRNFIGMDLKGARIWKGSQQALAENLSNVAFVRALIQDLPNFFEPGEFSELWITFPDPQPKKSDIRRRLTNPRFMDMYKTLIAPKGRCHLKTDNLGLFNYTLEILESYSLTTLEYTNNLYQSKYLEDHREIQTYYEKLWLGQGLSIKYLFWEFTP